ncbi:helix-turn-helix transcriptional regulator [Evansella sp. AB-rgal1]|uniref:helix-turn-helix transcriptional regulator n=1 Tax=Evansella sp. AB-rgal1 TaxID=3242696 RepID=UPI00359D6560
MSEGKYGRRILALREIFLRETDEDHQLSIKELVEKLKLEIPDCTADSKAVKRYIEALRAMDIEIMENKEKFGEIFYSHQDRLFETYQLRLLIDPILSARFITEDEKRYLVSRLKKMTSKHIAKTLPDPIVYLQSINMDYNLIRNHIDTIHRAISESKMISFQYGDFNINKEFQLRHDAAFYNVKPSALIWESDFYYLIGDDVKYGEANNPRNYRLDRMRSVTITEERFIRERRDISTYVQHSFHMFGGEDEWITIQFNLNRVALNGVIDKFGLDADIRKIDESTFILKAKAKISEGLKGWILAWGRHAKVLSPSSLVEEMKVETQKMVEAYNDLK